MVDFPHSGASAIFGADGDGTNPSKTQISAWGTEVETRINALGVVFDSYADAAAETVPAVVSEIAVKNGDHVLIYVRDASGTALTTADGAKWAPANDPSPYHFGAVLDGDWNAAVTAATNDAAALALFFAFLCDGSGRRASWPAGKIARSDSRFSGLSGNHFIDFGGGGIDFRNLPNDDGDGVGALFSFSGSLAATVNIASITATVDGNNKENVSIEATAHGVAAGDDFLIYSDDTVDIGHDATNERRGQMVRARSITDADNVVIEEPLFQTLPTNPKLSRISWVENIVWMGAEFRGPGRRAGSYTDSSIIGYTGPSFTYCRNVHVSGLVLDGIDYQSISFDNCIDCSATQGQGRVDPETPSSVGAIQYCVVAKNACTRCYFAHWTTQGFRHPFDHTRNTNPGIARDLVVEHFNCSGNWRGAIAMHGNARDSWVRHCSVVNGYDGIDIRAPGWKLRDLYFERVRIAINGSDNPSFFDIDGFRCKDVVQAVGFDDANIWIGTNEVRDLSIRNGVVDGCTGNAIDLDFSAIPVFSEADSAVTAGTTTSMTVGSLALTQLNLTSASGITIQQFETLTQPSTGASGYVLNIAGSVVILQRVSGNFNTSAELTGSSSGGQGANSVPTSVTTLDMFDSSGALTGAVLTFDPDGGGSGAEVERTVTHTHSAGSNVFTWSSAVGTAPTAGVATYKLRTVIDGVNVENLNVRNGAGRAVQLYGNIRAPRIANIIDNSDTVLSVNAIWLRSTADNYVRAAEISGLDARNKLGVLQGSDTQGTRIDGNFPTRIAAVEYIANGGKIADAEFFRAAGMAYRGSDGATDIADMLGVLPVAPFCLAHWGAAEDGATDDFAALDAADTYAASVGEALHFRGATIYIDPTGQQLTPAAEWRGQVVLSIGAKSSANNSPAIDASGWRFDDAQITLAANHARGVQLSGARGNRLKVSCSVYSAVDDSNDGAVRLVTLPSTIEELEVSNHGRAILNLVADTWVNRVIVSDYVQGWNNNAARAHVGSITCMGQNANASGAAGENGILHSGGDDCYYGPHYIKDAGEHAVRIAGSASSKGLRLGVTQAVNPAGNALKVRPDSGQTVQFVSEGVILTDAGGGSITHNAADQGVLIERAVQSNIGYINGRSDATALACHSVLEVNSTDGLTVGEIAGFDPSFAHVTLRAEEGDVSGVSVGTLNADQGTHAVALIAPGSSYGISNVRINGQEKDITGATVLALNDFDGTYTAATYARDGSTNPAGTGTISDVVIDIASDATNAIVGNDSANYSIKLEGRAREWTPTYTSAGGAYTATYDIQDGWMQQTGDVVKIWGAIRTDSVSGGSGGARLALPVTVATADNNFGALAVGYMSNFAGDFPCAGYFLQGTSTCQLLYRTASNGAVSNLDTADLGTGANANWLTFSGEYHA